MGNCECVKYQTWFCITQQAKCSLQGRHFTLSPLLTGSSKSKRCSHQTFKWHLTIIFLICITGFFVSLKVHSCLVSEVQSWDSALMEMLRRGSEKRGHGSHRNPFLSLKLCLPLNLIRFWYQAFFSYASLPLQHAWNCTALSIIYPLSFAYCFLWMPSLGHLQPCFLWYDALLHLPHCADPPPLQV